MSEDTTSEREALAQILAGAWMDAPTCQTDQMGRFQADAVLAALPGLGWVRAEGTVEETHDRLLNRDPDDENEPDVPTAPAEVARLRAVEGAVQALHDRLSRERPYSLGSGYVDLLREALAAKDVTL